MNKNCVDCGFENKNEDVFCRNCGKKLPDQKTQEKQFKETPIQQKTGFDLKHEKPKKINSDDMSKKVLVISLIAIILSFVAIVLAVVVQPSFEIGEESIGIDEIKNDAVTGNKILDGTVTDLDIINSGISRIASNSITGNMILSNAINSNHISNDVLDSISSQVVVSNNSITSDKIVNGEIKTQDIDDNSITSEKIINGEIESEDISDNAVGSSEIADDAVGSSEIDDNSITQNDIGPGAVRTSELDDDAVTYDKMNMKIRYDKSNNVYNGSQIAHGLAEPPESVVVTPIYDPSIESGNYILHANVISVDATYFTIALMYTNTTSNEIFEVPNSSPWNTIDIYWIAAYTQT